MYSSNVEYLFCWFTVEAFMVAGAMRIISVLLLTTTSIQES